MNQFEISEAQEWQLFELLEGNLSAEEAARLQKDIASQPALAYHYNLLKQTYSIAPNIHFPEAQSLKKQSRNKQIFLWTSTAVAAAIAILLLWKPMAPATNKSNPSGETHMARLHENQNDGLAASDLQQHKAITIPSQASAKGIRPTNSQSTINLTRNLTSEKIHPLIAATNNYRGQKNDSQQNTHLTIIEIIKKTNNTSLAQQMPDQHSIDNALQFSGTENQNPHILPTPFGQQWENNFSDPDITPSTKGHVVKHRSSRKTGLALAKSFYLDGKTMIQNGHVPHVKIKAINKSHSLLPTIEMGVRLENNVIMASFNQ